jgi:hypothetical protein
MHLRGHVSKNYQARRVSKNDNRRGEDSRLQLCNAQSKAQLQLIQSNYQER